MKIDRGGAPKALPPLAASIMPKKPYALVKTTERNIGKTRSRDGSI